MWLWLSDNITGYFQFSIFYPDVIDVSPGKVEIVKGFMTGEMSEYEADIFSLVTESDKNVEWSGVVWPGLDWG